MQRGTGTGRAREVDALFADIAKPDAPGCALGVMREGSLIYSKGYGQAVLEHGIPITPRTAFDLGSVSKQFTAAAIVLLAQQGKLSLDDEVRKWVPETPDYIGKTADGLGAAAGSQGTAAQGGSTKKLTIRHLLHHTGGVRNYDTMMALAGIDFSGRTGDREALDYIVRQKGLNFSPGDDYLYSNSGYFLLSQVVKAAGGKTLREFAAENLFQPLGMKDTLYLDDTTLIVPRRATGYEPRQGGGFRIDMSNFEQTGDGAVQTTVEDFALWDRNFYSGRVLGKQGLEWLQTPGALNDGTRITYAFGLVVSRYKGLPIVEHGGSWAGYRAHYLRFPEQKLSVVCLCNASDANPGRRARQVAEVYLGGSMKDDAITAAKAPGAGPAVQRQSAQVSSAEWKEYAGLYRSERLGSVLRVFHEEGKLKLRSGAQTLEMAPAGEAEFRPAQSDADFRLRFERAGHSKYRLVRINPEGTTAAYEQVEAFTPTAGQQREFLGSFYSEEADVTYTIFEREGKLHLRIGKWTEMPVEPLFRDACSFRMGQIVFERGAGGSVTGFSLQAGRVRNIRFLKQEAGK